MPFLSVCATAICLLTLHHAHASVGVLDINNLLEPNLDSKLLTHHEEQRPYAPWSHKPHCTTSTRLPTLGQKYCVYTSNTTGPHGLSLIFPPSSAHLATEYLDDNPLDSFLTQAEAENLFLGDGPPWTIVDIPGKDKGVVATRKIKQYETFMVDQAAVVVDMEAEKALSQKENQNLLKVAVDRLLVPEMIRDMSGKHEGHKHKTAGEKEGFAGADDREEEDEEEGKLEEDVMKTNAFGGTVAEVNSRVLYPLISRINHACAPNSFVLFSRAGVSMAIKAYRDIAPGEEITISYLLLGIPFAKRQHLIHRWGFTCTCDLCSLPERQREASDLRRTMIAQAEEKMIELAEAGEFDDAVALAEEAVEMIREEGIYPTLTDSYAMLAMLYREKGDRAKSEEYGRKTQQLLGDLGFLGVGEERQAWSLEKMMGNIEESGGIGSKWTKGPAKA
ncbi:SET domain-containing protein [Cucurbitaria berberidis CBS 394.84]|uniref:SET domain-containing protein n=1 Tax=Cucurbitaria berberidis CBS 394.84 TaxID=1168544 RepID=A0A9P4L8R5_9PLEO|nr:SET domain-containing protein [Cucurbitaria berberidis CBS 394.84]KAF1846335.1 SET domain-containing protein [Cucurbitaria berberidis CBS 394.84]